MIFKTFLIFLSTILLSSCGPEPTSNLDLNSTIPAPSVSLSSQSTPNLKRDIVVSLNTQYGPILIKLYSQEAPNTVANFINKIKSNFYNNLTFHRVEPGFVVQGGDPLGNGTGGDSIKSEINSITFKIGSVGLARGPNIEVSNDSQFFICLSTESCQSLTDNYVNFGEVVSGMEFVNQIKIGDKITNIIDTTK
jgi:cyclophilin family peptidyl-prolyl cis-trans isomerase